MKHVRRFVILAATLALASNAVQLPALASAAPGRGAASIQLKDGRRGIVMPSGYALVFSKDHRMVELHHLKREPYESPDGKITLRLPSPGVMTSKLAKPQMQVPYAPGWLVAVFRPGSTPLRDVLALQVQDVVAARDAASRARNVSLRYTNDYATNRAFAELGVDRIERLFRSSAPPPQPYGLNPALAYRIHIAASNPAKAIRELRKLGSIAYVSPDWVVSPMHSEPHRVPSGPSIEEVGRLTSDQSILSPTALPRNFASKSSLQSLLNAPSVDALAAYDEIARHFRQLPGQGEIITNVSIGDVDDATNKNDPCFPTVQSLGPTTVLVGNQHYLDLPSMPLIPAYTADIDGTLSGSNEVCAVDPSIDEIGLDFSMMAPLPHDLQRPDERGKGFTDLLGIAPGAQYRLVVPLDPETTITDIDAALLAAATQRPRPNIITASLGFGFDTNGFPSRYLEEDPLSEAIVSTIVHQYGIVVCIAAGDGLRTFTNAAVGPAGGSAPTDVVAPAQTPTTLDDDEFSTTPSLVFDSGAIDVGGTTLDDIFAAPPNDPESQALSSQHAFAETRWDGSTLFSSGYGQRVDLSAPSDNVISFEHQVPSGAADQVEVVNNGGTSASAPEVAAIAAVTQQVARLTGRPLDDPIRLRAFLRKTAVPVPPVSQADAAISVGPQANLRRTVEALMEAHGIHDKPSVAGVAVEQRRTLGTDYLNALFMTYTDPSDINLANSEGFTGLTTDANATAWITVAPNWEFVPNGARFRLGVAGKMARPLAITPWARLLPETILRAAGLPLASEQKRTVKLQYEALVGSRPIASAEVELTFGPSGSKVFFGFAPAPSVPPVVSGPKIPVTYDLTKLTGAPPYVSMNRADLVVSEVGRGDPEHVLFGDFGVAYIVPLSLGSKGTVDVPVSALEGGGIYGVQLEFNRTSSADQGYPSTVAYTRVEARDESASRPAAPLLSIGAELGGHFLEIPYAGSFDVSYDVSKVAGADGAMVEISAAAPGWDAGEPNFLYNTFNNPNGSVRDRNGIESGSVYYVPAAGRTGRVRVDARGVLLPTLDHVVRVIPMRGGVAVGEASDVSTVSMDGVVPRYGGTIGINFGVDATDSGAFFTEGATLASGATVSAVETFDQTTNAGEQLVMTNFGNGAFYTTGWGVWPGNLGLVGFDSSQSGTVTASYSILNTATHAIASPWNPPFPNSDVLDINEGTENQLNDLGAFLVGFGAPYQLFGADIKQRTFGTLFDVTAPISGASLPVYGGIGLNALTNTAILAGYDFDTFSCGATSPTIVSADIQHGTVSSFAGSVLDSFASGVAVNSSKNVAAVPSLICQDMALYNLSTHAAVDVPSPGAGTGGPTGGLWPVTDETSGDFLVYQLLPGDVDTNINALSSVLLYSPNGSLLRNIERFVPPAASVVTANGIQINTSTHTGYVPAMSGQLTPFSY